MQQARTLHHQLPEEGQEQGQLQAQVGDGWHVPITARPQEQAKEQAQGQATIKEEGGPRQGLSYGWSE
jgi:hypothetical protein